jgi:WD40 repeat protein
MAVSSDGKVLAVAGAYGAIEILDAATGQPRVQPEPRGPVLSLAFAPDGRTLASTSADRSVVLWDLASGKRRQQFREHSGHLLFTPDGRTLVLGGDDGIVRVWRQQDDSSFKAVQSFRAPAGWAHRMGICPDDQSLVLAGEAIWRYDSSTGKQLEHRKMDRSAKAVVSRNGQTWARFSNTHRLGLAFPDATEVFATLDFGIVRGEKKPHAIKLTNHVLNWLAFSADGRFLAGEARKIEFDKVGPDGVMPFGPPTSNVLIFWDLPSGREIRRRTVKWKDVGEAVFSPDGRMLALIGDKNAGYLWEVATGRQRRRFAGHGDIVNALAFSADGKKLGTASDDGTILIWDVYATQSPAPKSAGDFKRSWETLGVEDGESAYEAVCALIRAGDEALPLFREQLEPVTPESVKKLKALARDLDSDRFQVRQKAAEALREAVALGRITPEEIETIVKGAVPGGGSLEFQRRAEQLLAGLKDVDLLPERLRRTRAVEVLEKNGSSEACKLLEALAKGAPEAWLTREARMARERLTETQKRPAKG